MTSIFKRSAKLIQLYEKLLKFVRRRAMNCFLVIAGVVDRAKKI